MKIFLGAEKQISVYHGSNQLDHFSVFDAHGSEFIVRGPMSDTSFEVAKAEANTEYDLIDEDYRSDLVFDIGGGYGEFSIKLAIMGSKKVIVYEPNPFLWKYLEANISDIPQITLFREGVLDISTETTIYFRETGTASGSINEVQYDPLSPIGLERIKLPTKITDVADVITRNQFESFVMKIDAEGSEYRIVDRLIMTNSLDKCKLLIIEYHRGKQDLASKLKAIGFKLQVIKKSSEMGLIYARRN
jgi:FkbM family methyltransferase